MSISDRLACALERNDEQPNIALAEDLAKSANKADIAELVDITSNGTKAERHDAIKALYELAERRPELVAPHIYKILKLLNTKDNRMIWGAMSALAALAEHVPATMIENLDQILKAADKGSVIAKDKVMVLLSTLNSIDKYREQVTPIILNRLTHSAVNQVPMYVELAAPTIAGADKAKFISLVQAWHDTIPQLPKKKRLAKVLRSLT